MKLLTVMGVFACALAADGREANWPQWRGPGGTAISVEKGLPVEWSDSKNVLWKTPIIRARGFPTFPSPNQTPGSRSFPQRNQRPGERSPDATSRASAASQPPGRDRRRDEPSLCRGRGAGRDPRPQCIGGGGGRGRDNPRQRPCCGLRPRCRGSRRLHPVIAPRGHLFAPADDPARREPAPRQRPVQNSAAAARTHAGR